MIQHFNSRLGANAAFHAFNMSSIRSHDHPNGRPHGLVCECFCDTTQVRNASFVQVPCPGYAQLQARFRASPHEHFVVLANVQVTQVDFSVAASFTSTVTSHVLNIYGKVLKMPVHFRCTPADHAI